MNEKAKADADRRLARIAGQVRGLRKMVQEDRYCVDILTQVAALRAALDQLGVTVLTGHIEGCVVGHGSETAHENTKEMTPHQLLAEIRLVLSRFL